MAGAGAGGGNEAEAADKPGKMFKVVHNASRWSDAREQHSTATSNVKARTVTLQEAWKGHTCC
jgi:hypothetical protein